MQGIVNNKFYVVALLVFVDISRKIILIFCPQYVVVVASHLIFDLYNDKSKLENYFLKNNKRRILLKEKLSLLTNFKYGDIQKVRSLKIPDFWSLLSPCLPLFVFSTPPPPPPHPTKGTFVLARIQPLPLNFYTCEI